MKLTALIVLLMSLALLSEAQTTTVRSDIWKSVSACGVEFSLPSEVQEIKAYPIDSCVKKYRGENIYITLDVIYSPHTPRTAETFRTLDSDEPEFQVIEIQPSGVRSLMVTYFKASVPTEKEGLNYVAKLAVPSVGKDKRGLMMWVYSKTPEGQNIARKIFASIGPAMRRNKRSGN